MSNGHKKFLKVMGACLMLLYPFLIFFCFISKFIIQHTVFNTWLCCFDTFCAPAQQSSISHRDYVMHADLCMPQPYLCQNLSCHNEYIFLYCLCSVPKNETYHYLFCRKENGKIEYQNQRIYKKNHNCMDHFFIYNNHLILGNAFYV